MNGKRFFTVRRLPFTVYQKNMGKIKILAIGRRPQILQTVIRLVNNNPHWECTGAITDEEALDAFATDAFRLVLLTNGIGPESSELLCTSFRSKNPEIIILQHYGGGSGLLFGEITGALEGG